MRIIETEVRGTKFRLLGHTRSLELCSKMNYETENLDFIDQMKEGETMFDLGACEGRFTIYAALNGIRCYSFEPDSYNYDVLLQNLKINNLNKRHVEPYKVAVGSTNKMGKLKVGQPWAGGHQKVIENEEMRDDLKFTFKEVEIVEVMSLDAFIQGHKLDCPDYLKIDIDGSEMSFILGAQKTLGNCKLKRIIFELEISDKNFDGIVCNLLENGFKEEARFQIPNEPFLFNIIFIRLVL